MDSLKKSIKRDGFNAPILVRKIKNGKYEIVSGNHRFMAAQELNYKQVPCIIANLTDKQVKRLAVNLNLIHGNPNAELLAPFLAEMDDDTLREIHLESELLKDLLEFDNTLKLRLESLNVPDVIDRNSPMNKNIKCKCEKCGRIHFAKM
jgi:ParB family chromosome partitioning protein